eukprot:CAMPEP_0114382344 /NCGR_PEP_ID=MMETSP0102-20121206/4039_1 /TAXON_ID=38822 ORGANISM="Pteridomonas danica, Strain PT" /NCGR_SAMPLE_ID=MMETSP0102 /ASSEMBLY_ACC=CAM_ASM_000212 /LENGTH=58 /DNA_ID=CAMNT_0001538099 /DNA_START=534 /DNA_END=710 /DNA_ORIENTATION=+
MAKIDPIPAGVIPNSCDASSGMRVNCEPLIVHQWATWLNIDQPNILIFGESDPRLPRL